MSSSMCMAMRRNMTTSWLTEQRTKGQGEQSPNNLSDGLEDLGKIDWCRKCGIELPECECKIHFVWRCTHTLAHGRSPKRMTNTEYAKGWCRMAREDVMRSIVRAPGEVYWTCRNCGRRDFEVDERSGLSRGMAVHDKFCRGPFLDTYPAQANQRTASAERVVPRSAGI